MIVLLIGVFVMGSDSCLFTGENPFCNILGVDPIQLGFVVALIGTLIFLLSIAKICLSLYQNSQIKNLYYILLTSIIALIVGETLILMSGFSNTESDTQLLVANLFNINAITSSFEIYVEGYAFIIIGVLGFVVSIISVFLYKRAGKT